MQQVDGAGKDALHKWCAQDSLCGCSKGVGGSRISISAVLSDSLSDASPSLYPVNTLRNEALGLAAATPFTLGLDADFIVGGPAEIPLPPTKTLYLLPCFRVNEAHPENAPLLEAADPEWPLTKEQLVEWHSAESRVVAYGESEDWPFGHMDVEYSRWYTATEPFEIFTPNVYFEPYFIGRSDELTRFDERYVRVANTTFLVTANLSMEHVSVQPELFQPFCVTP
jgi:hypothetical protein